MTEVGGYVAYFSELLEGLHLEAAAPTTAPLTQLNARSPTVLCAHLCAHQGKCCSALNIINHLHFAD